jgi:hypothetical protein
VVALGVWEFKGELLGIKSYRKHGERDGKGEQEACDLGDFRPLCCSFPHASSCLS